MLQAASDKDHPAVLLVTFDGCTTPEDLMLLTEADIDAAILTDSTGSPVRMPASIKRKILTLKDYYNSWPDAERDLLGWLSRDEDDFIKFVAAPPKPPTPPTIATSTTPMADEFGKGLRRSVSDYKPFKDKKLWNQWHRQLVTTGHDHGIEHIFDP
jgi:hypothetical protein